MVDGLRASLLVSACAGLLGTLGAEGAQAQVLSAPAAPDTASGPAATADAAGGLATIVVTAQKRQENVQKTPLSIAVVKGDVIKARGVTTLFDTGPLVAGMVFSRAPDDGLALTFRGVGTPARNQSFDQSIALFIDGAFVGKGRLYGADLFDTDHIEFIKSTQSTLLGKNTDLGAISVVTRKPGDVFEADLSAGARLDHGGYILDGGVDLPVSDALTVRVAGHANDTNGDVRNSENGGYFPRNQDFGGRLTAVYAPAAPMKVTFSYQYTYDHTIGNGFQYVDPDHVLPPGLGEGVLDGNNDAFTSLGEDGESYHKLAANIVNLTEDFQAGQAQVTSISSFMSYRMHLIDDFDFGPKDGNVFDRHEDYWQVSQELRLASDQRRALSYMVGVSVFYSDWDSDELQHFDTPLQVGPDPFDTIFLGSFDDQFKQRTLSLAAFAQATWRITPSLRLAAGLRYTDEMKSGSWGRPAFAPFTLWNQVLNPPFPETPLRFDTAFPDANASIEYDATRNVMLYAAVGQGTKTGGFAESSSVPSGNPAIDARIGNEVSQSVEVGFKSTIFGGAARFNLAAFYINIPSYQDTNFTGAAFISRNIPVRSGGAEAEFLWRIAPWLTFDNAWTYADARALLVPNFSPPQSPRWTGHSGLLVETPIVGDRLVLRASGYVRYRSTMHNLDSPVFRSAPLTTLDLSIGVGSSDGRWALDLVGTNVTNAISADFSFPPPDPTLPSSVRIESPSPLRELTLRLSARF